MRGWSPYSTRDLQCKVFLLGFRFMGKILTRYIFFEITMPFCLSLLIFTCILFTARVLELVDLVVSRGVSILHISKMLFFVLPSFLEVTVPMAFLLAILWGFGRLSTDKEIIALKSCGMSLSQMAVPLYLLTGVLLGISFFLTLSVRPWSNAGLDRVFYDVSKTRATAGLKEKTFNSEFSGLVIYAEEIEPPGTVLKGIMIADSRTPHRKDTIFAHDGLIVPSAEGNLLTLRLNKGTVHSMQQTEKGHQTTHFSVYDVILDTAALLAHVSEPNHSPKDMTIVELLHRLSQSQEASSQHNKALVELHRRLALPFACVVFSLIALPLSVRTTWAFRSIGFGMSLGIILLYYLLLTAGETFGERGVLSPAIALWIPNGVLGGLGAYLFSRVTQEKPLFPLLTWLSQGFSKRPLSSLVIQ